MNKNQKGFALVEGLLILIVVGILAGTGWYVWNSRNNTDKSLDNTTKTSAFTKKPAKANVTSEANIPADWPVYKDTTNNLSFSYPSSWNSIPDSYSQQTINITSPDIKVEDIVPFGGTKVTAGNKITLIFTTQTGKTLDQIFSSSLAGDPHSNVKKESRKIDGVRAFEYEFGYEGPAARNIIFVKGSQYYVKGLLNAPDVSKSGPGYDTFIKILDSVEVK